MTGLDDIAHELHAVPRTEFVAARDARVKELRSGGDRALAEELKRLTKPTPVAWAVNAAVRAEPKAARDLVDLVGSPPEAHDERARTAQFDALVDTLARAARAALADGGEQANATRRADIAAALRAAPLADDTSAFLGARLQREPAAGDSLEAALLASTGPASRGRERKRAGGKGSGTHAAEDTTDQARADASRRDAARRRLMAELAEAKAERRTAAQRKRDAARDVVHAERALDAARKAAAAADAADEHAAALVADLADRVSEA